NAHHKANNQLVILSEENRLRFSSLRMTYRTFILLYALDKSEGLPRHSENERLSYVKAGDS
ncbi:MAG: hypothetical protein IKV02_02965, partial [Clostridia bacterium]|nr:hypothetical protein [Clostridia bacterium]